MLMDEKEKKLVSKGIVFCLTLLFMSIGTRSSIAYTITEKQNFFNRTKEINKQFTFIVN